MPPEEVEGRYLQIRPV
jgi:hypothetical protein